MKKEMNYKTISLTFSILVICFAITFYALGWTEPTVTPPGGNIDTPLNTGNIGQEKIGGLILNMGGADLGLIVDDNGDPTKGFVGIGTTSPSEKLDVSGNIKASGSICANGGADCIGDEGFGNWTEGLSKNTVYQAATDGFVVAHAYNYGSNINGNLWVLTDSSNPPTTIRGKASNNGGDHNRDTITIPVRKGDYWKVTINNGTNDYTINWLPFGF